MDSAPDFIIRKDITTLFIKTEEKLFLRTEKESGYNDEKTIQGIEEYFSYVKEGLSPEIYDDQARAEAMQNGLCAMGLLVHGIFLVLRQPIL